MKRHVRQLSRKIEWKLRNVRRMTANINFGRSNSSYSYPTRSTNVTSAISTSLSDSEDEYVFEATTENEPDANDRRPSVILIPCQFCHSQQSSEVLDRHQLVCSQNPANRRRRQHLTANNTTIVPRRRAVSDQVSSSSPSAPPRSRSPSPTEGFTVPSDLMCPILQTLFRDPVVASDGHTYERSAITNWLGTSKVSPITRETISINKLNPNRVIKKMADDFRAECQRKKSLYKYKLDVDVKKTEEASYLKTDTKTFYQAEWIKNNDSKIMLVHLIGENAEKFAEINCQLEPHPNIVRTFGRVEHNDTNIILLQEYLPRQTLFQLIKHINQNLSITILDTILYQIVSALGHLANHGIIHGNVTTNNVFIYQFGEITENILVKLTNIGDLETSNNDTDKTAPELLKSKDHYSEKSDVYALGILTQELYSLELATNDKDITDRQTLFERCLVTDPNERPTFNELTKSMIDLMSKRKFIYPTIHE